MTFEPRFMRYRYVDSRAFRRGVKKYASLRKQIAAKVNRMLDNPYDSELLGKKGASDLSRQAQRACHPQGLEGRARIGESAIG